jgi:hypothetical protein
MKKLIEVGKDVKEEAKVTKSRNAVRRCADCSSWWKRQMTFDILSSIVALIVMYNILKNERR